MNNDDKDRELLHQFDSLDEDLQMEVLELLAANGTSEGETSAQMHGAGPVDSQRVLERVSDKLGITRIAKDGQPHGYERSRRPPSGWKIPTFAAAAVVAAVLVLAVTPGPVSAALQKVFSFVPGIGTVQQSQGVGQTAVLQHAVAATWQGSPVQVTGIMVTPTEVMVGLSGTGTMQMPKHVSWVTSTGQTLNLDSWGGVGAGGTQWSGNYSATGKFGAVQKNLSGTVVIGPGTSTQIPVQLQLAKGVAGMSQLGPTQTHQGITLTAIAGREGQTAHLTLVPQYQGPFDVWDVTPPVGISGRPGIEISDRNGHTYKPDPVLGLGPNSQFTFEPAKGVTDYQVTIPQVDATYTGDVRVRLPIPTAGSEAVDKTVNLGGFPVEITKVQRVHDPSASDLGLRMYFNLHANLVAPKELHSLQLNVASEAKFDSKTGAYEWMEVVVKPNQRFINLHLSQPQVYIRGPWTFTIHIPGEQPQG